MTTKKTNIGESIEEEDFSHSLFGPEENGNVASLISKLPLRYADEAIPIDSGEERYTLVYRNKSLPGKLISNIHPRLNTLNKLFNNSVQLFADRPCFGYRKYNYETGVSDRQFSSFSYSEVNERRMNFGSGILYVLKNNPFKLKESKCHAKIGNHLRDWRKYGEPSVQEDENWSFIVSIFSANRLEWVLSDLACAAYSFGNTSLYDTLGPDATRYILDLTRSPILICSKEKVRRIINMKRDFPDLLGDLITIVSMDPLFHTCANSRFKDEDQSLMELARATNITLYDFDQVEKLGKSSRIRELPPTGNTLNTIAFTSGTTGSKPKGVVLTHENAATSITFLASAMPQINPGRAFIFLPLTHIYERGTTGFALTTGYYLGFPQLTITSQAPVNSFDNLIEDLRLFKPTYLSLVPRILTKMESVIKAAVSSSNPDIASSVNKIISYKLKKHCEFDGSKGLHKEYDNYAPYKDLRSIVGFDNLIWTQTASAPISGSTLSYLRASLNIGIKQLYGLTETYGASTQGGAYECKPGSCGSVGIGEEVKLKEIPEMGYYAKENKGEVLFRGPMVFHGYFRNKSATEECIDNDGWFHTGDVATIDRDTGRLFIVDRVKNFFKLAQGEYVSPEKVENVYLSFNPILSQLFIHGDRLKSYLVGIAGIDHSSGMKFLHEFCGYKKSNLTSTQLLIEMNKFKNRQKFLLKINSSVGKKLQGFERLHNIHIDINPLTVERNVVTPTFKIKRAIAAKYFSDTLTRLYEESPVVETKPKL